MTSPMLELRNIETFYGPIMAIRGVSLEVNEGEIVAVLGANGAGKTTLLKTATGALDSRKGQVLFEGAEIQNRDPDWVARRGIAHVPEGREVFPFLTVTENLAMGAYTRRDRDGIARDLETVYGYFPILRELDSKMAGYLSGGQQQMLAIARGVMARPRLLMLDEPSLGLSPALVSEIFDIIRKLNTEQGLTILLVEQNALAALEIVSDGYLIENGRVVMHDTAQALKANSDIQEFYLGGGPGTNFHDIKHYSRRKRWLS